MGDRSLPAQSIRGKGEKTVLESCLAAGGNNISDEC